VSLGSGNTIRNNEITSVVGTGGGSGFGIMNYANDTLIESNRISSVTVGVYVQIATNVLVSDNRLMNMSDGIFFTIDATGKYRNNLTAGVTTLASRGTDAGGND
jgi:nitrous oxidase accessory protein NosD